MAEIITMPRLSDTMTEGVVAKWLKKVGDHVEEGDILAEIETDKATMEFESFHEGTLLHIGIQEGETADVDSLLAVIGEKGEDFQALLDSGNGNGEQAEKAKAEAPDAEESKEESKEESADESQNEGIDLPEGMEVITMPRLSDTMTEGTVAKWLKNIGDAVEEGDILAEIETDKATMEFESFHQGTLLYIGVEEGKTAEVDAVLAVIGEKGTDMGPYKQSLSQKTKATEQPTEDKDSKPAATSVAQQSKPPPSPALSAPAPVSAPTVQVGSNGRIVASPLARKMAEERNINLNQVSGSGEGGRIIKRDIENFTPGVAASSQMPFVPRGQESFEEVT